MQSPVFKTQMVPVSNISESDDSEWDLVIRPQSTLFALNLGDVWRYRDLLYLFTRRDMVAFYKQTDRKSVG